VAGRQDAVVLADFLDRAGAERLAVRLQAEGVGAEVWSSARGSALLPADQPPLGPSVVVRRADHGHALQLAKLFAEVDAGTSRWAPTPRDYWQGPPHQQLLAAGLLLLLALGVAILLLAAASV
jgi:hypothetical protein